MNRSCLTKADDTCDEAVLFAAIVFSHPSRGHGAGLGLRIPSILILMLGCCTIAVPLALQYVSSVRQAELANRSDHGVDDWH